MDIIGFQELLLIAFVALLVIGPERLPETLRTLGLWFGRLRRSFTSVKNEIEKEIGMDEIRRQLHNEAVLDEMKRIEQEVQNSLSAEPGQHNSIDPTIEQSGGEVEPASEPGDDTPAVANLASAADPGDDAAPADAAPADATPADTAPETTPLPRSEAELEALHQRKRRQQMRKES